jgi:hypothetical protein
MTENYEFKKQEKKYRCAPRGLANLTFEQVEHDLEHFFLRPENYERAEEVSRRVSRLTQKDLLRQYDV